MSTKITAPNLSASVYLSVLFVTQVVAMCATYLPLGEWTIKGQPPGIWLTGVGFLLAVVAWLLVPTRRRAEGLFAWLLILAAASWLIHLGLAVFHGDNFNHTVWLTVPILAMIFLRPPTSREGLAALRVLGWALAVTLVLARLSEAAGIISPAYVSPDLVKFDKEHYWLPLSGYWGVEGRWPGPFGGSAETGLAGAATLIIGLMSIRRWTSWVLVTVGATALVLAGTRSSYLAAITGGLILLVFARFGPLARVSQSIRVSALAVGAAVVAGYLFVSGPGATGRGEIWTAFLELWRESPLLGVGTSGVMTSGGLAEISYHAHNFLIDDLARYGTAGFSLLVVTLALTLTLQVGGAGRGLAGPLALTAVVLVSYLTNGTLDSLSPHVYFLAFVAGAGAAYSTGRRDRVGCRNGLDYKVFSP
jgi:hypothetical protein